VNAVLEAATEVQRFCDEQGWRACFIGGVAVQRWGEPRLTQDVDLTILTGFGSEAPYIDGILARFAGRRADTRDFALRHRVVLAATSGGVPIDISLGALPYEERVLERSSWFDLGDDRQIRTCSAEDLVVLKGFAGRDQDWLDIRGIAQRQGAALDAELILTEAEPLLALKDVLDDLDRLRRLLSPSH
jgi:hypothetical protein